MMTGKCITMPTLPVQGLNQVDPADPMKRAWQHYDPDSGFPDPLLDMIANRFKLLGEPLRLKLIAALTTGEKSVGELVSLTGAGQPNVSKHLNALMMGGLISRRKRGTSILYSVTDASVLELCNIVCAGMQTHVTAQARAIGIQNLIDSAASTFKDSD